jgi:recombinational DNA repair protein RecT
MTKNSQNQGGWLDTLDPVKMVDDEKVKDQFINTYSKIHRKSIDDATVVWEKESIYYKKAVSGSEKLNKCTKLSLYSAFLEIAIQGLSIQPGQKGEAYLEARSQKVKEGNAESWIIVCYLRISAYGELNLRIQSGQIIRMLNPIVVYDGDAFQPRTKEGVLYVDYEPRIPRKSKKIIACWVRIVLPGGINDFKWLTEEDIDRLKKYSIPHGQTQPNALYTANEGQIDPGFLEAKTIKHAMRAYTKLRVGDNVMFEDEELEEKDNKAKSVFDENKEEKRTITVDPSKPTEDGKKPIIDEEPF